MKMLSRIAVILAAALVVVGITIGLSHTSLGQGMMPNRGESVRRQPLSVTAGQNNSVNQADFNGQAASQDPHSADGFGFLQVVQNFAMIGLIVLTFTVVSRFLQRRKASSSEI